MSETTVSTFHRVVTVEFEAKTGRERIDLEIAWSANTATVADLIAMARSIDGGACPGATVAINGRVVPPTTRLEDATMPNGSIVACGPKSPTESPVGAPPTESPVGAPAETPVPTVGLTLDHVGGCDAGGSVVIPDAATVTLRNRQGLELAAVIARTDSGYPSSWAPGDYRDVGAEVLVVSDHHHVSAHRRPDPPDGEPVVVSRPPRVVPPRQAEMPARPVVPPRPPDPAPLSWASLLAPIPIGIAMALLFRPYFLLFTAAGPVMFFGRWWESKRRHRRACIEWQREIYDRNREFQDRVYSTAEMAATELRNQHLNICEVLRRADAGGQSLWERRPMHEDFATVAIAYRDLEWPDEPVTATPGLGASDTTAHTMLSTVPFAVDLRRYPIVGIIGGGAAQSLVRAIIAQLVVLHGPAHLRVGLAQDRVEEWEWLKWLPHYLAPDDDVGSGGASRPWRVRVHGVGASSAALGTALVSADPGDGETTLIVAASRDELPTQCSLLIDCRSYEAASARPEIGVIDVATGTTTTAPNLIGVGAARAEWLARRLAGFADPEMGAGTGALPKAIALADLESWHDVAPIEANWRDGSCDGLVAAIGTGVTPYVVDLVQDGPHALVAGTTGSGKSELLRTWVAALAGRYAPRDCAFVLIDFKGGGAFDAVAALPHVAAVVTDLDEGLAQRGLRSLRAELRDREQLLRDRDAPDIAAYRALGYRDLPRLVLIIDEFATLAAELPAFLDGLVDIAQRGRSLGVHMILATQRPAGVLDQKIRANTNLRICLRVQDSGDSIDVIDVRDAAALPRHRPGRALIRKGVDELSLVQCAHIGPSENRPNQGLRSRRFGADGNDLWRPEQSDQVGAVERILEAAKRCENSEFGAVARAPWRAPLPPALSRSELWNDAPPSEMAIPIGLEDRPDERTQQVWYWDRSAGPLLVVGGTDGERRAVMASVIDGVGRTTASIDTYVIHTEIGATVFAVNGWPGAIEADAIESIDRILLRCATAGPHSDPIVVIVERFDLLGTGATEADTAVLRDHLERVIARSARTVSFVIGGATERSIPSRIGAYAAQRLVLRLADPSGYAALGLRERTMPSIDAMGAVDPRASTAIRLAGAEDEDYRDLHFPVTTPVQTAPSVLRAGSVGVGSWQGSELVLPVGMDLITQRPFVARLSADEPFIIGGERRTGRTAAVAAFVSAALAAFAPSAAAPGPPSGEPAASAGEPGASARCPLDVVVIAGIARTIGVFPEWGPAVEVWVQDDGTSMGERIQGLDSPTLILLDDADRIDETDVGAIVEAARHGGHYLVVGCAADALRSHRSPIAALRAARNGIVLGFGRAEAEILRVAPLRFCGIDWQPGRGIGASQSEPTLVQLILTLAPTDSRHKVVSTMSS